MPPVGGRWHLSWVPSDGAPQAKSWSRGLETTVRKAVRPEAERGRGPGKEGVGGK